MSKTKKWMVAVLSFFFLLSAAGIGMITVKAADTGSEVFKYDWVAGNTLVGDISLDDVKSAYESEAARLTGEGWNFSDINIAANPLQNAWPNGFQGQAYIMAHLTGTPSTASQWGQSGYALLVFNPHDKAVYTLQDEFFTKFTTGWDMFALGYPVGNDFVTDSGVKVQNFSYGYVKAVENAPVFVNGKHIAKDDTTVDITADEYIANAVYPVYNPAPGATMQNYVSSFQAALADKTYDYPFTHNPQFDWNSMWIMRITGEELSGATLWGEANNALLMYTVSQNKMVLLVDDIAARYTGDGTVAGLWGQAKDAQFQVGDIVYQNFDNGYVKVEANKLSFVAGKSMDKEGNEIQNYTKEDTGKLADGVALEGDLTAEAVKTAFEAKYSDEMGIPASYVTYFPSTKVLYQRYLDEDGKVSEIYMRAADRVYAVEKGMYAYYSKPQDYSANWPGSTLLGLPTGDAFVYDGATYQNFDKGYMRMTETSAKPVVGANIASSGERTILDFSEQIFVSPDIKIPASFGVTGDELLVAFKAEYKKLAAAGFAVGVPGSEGIKVWTEYAQDANNEFADNRGMIVLALQSGDSTSRPIYDVTMYMVYNPEGKNVQLIKDNVMAGIEQFRSQLGAPVGEAFIAKNNITVQNFQMGYVYATANGSVSYKDNLRYDKETGEEVPIGGESTDPSASPSPEITDRKSANLTPLWIVLGVVGGLAVVGAVIFLLYKKGVLFKK